MRQYLIRTEGGPTPGTRAYDETAPPFADLEEILTVPGHPEGAYYQTSKSTLIPGQFTHVIPGAAYEWRENSTVDTPQ